MKIYTKQGDKGQSVLFDGTRVPKHHPRLETYGTVDELNSHLGLVIAACTPEQDPVKSLIATLQGQLLVLGSDLATPIGSKNEHKIRRINAGDVQFLEEQIDHATAQLPTLKRFILPGGTETAAQLHIARTVCRRAERLLTALMQLEPGTTMDQSLVYLNRLSDLLFTAARLANQLQGVRDVEWEGL